MSPGQSLEMGCSARDLSPPPTTEFVTVNSLCLREKVLTRRCDMARVSGWTEPSWSYPGWVFTLVFTGFVALGDVSLGDEVGIKRSPTGIKKTEGQRYTQAA